jgi:hypothetical protein
MIKDRHAKGAVTLYEIEQPLLLLSGKGERFTVRQSLLLFGMRVFAGEPFGMHF